MWLYVQENNDRKHYFQFQYQLDLSMHWISPLPRSYTVCVLEKIESSVDMLNNMESKTFLTILFQKMFSYLKTSDEVGQESKMAVIEEDQNISLVQNLFA